MAGWWNAEIVIFFLHLIKMFPDDIQSHISLGTSQFILADTSFWVIEVQCTRERERKNTNKTMLNVNIKYINLGLM